MHYTECDVCGRRRADNVPESKQAEGVAINRLLIQWRNEQVVFDVCGQNTDCATKLLNDLSKKWLEAR